MSNYKTLKTYWGCGNKIFTENFKNKEYLPKIAVYAYNFGNFRNELDSDINKTTFFPEFDYFFYTDQNIKSNNWNIIKVPLQPRTEHMNSHRVTTKYYKYKKIPDELLGYDYILHIDCARLALLKNLTPNKIYNLIKNNQNVTFFGKKHPEYTSIEDEAFRAQINGKAGTEYIHELKLYISSLQKEKFKQKFTHTENCLFLRKVNDLSLNYIFPKVFDKLMELKLCRDQHIFSYVLQNYNFDPKKFLIVDLFS